MSDELHELKVTDRRRFIQEGDNIKENPEATARPEPPVPPETKAEPAPAQAQQQTAPKPGPGAPPQGPGPGVGTQPASTAPETEQTRKEAAQRRADQAAAGLPPADITTMIEFLAQQVTMYLGEPDPTGRASQPNLPAAGLFIDLLGTLQEKTKGNLTLEESQILDQILYALRLRYVQKRR
jgi:hypothetical protein